MVVVYGQPIFVLVFLCNWWHRWVSKDRNKHGQNENIIYVNLLPKIKSFFSRQPTPLRLRLGRARPPTIYTCKCALSLPVSWDLISLKWLLLKLIDPFHFAVVIWLEWDIYHTCASSPSFRAVSNTTITLLKRAHAAAAAAGLRMQLRSGQAEFQALNWVSGFFRRL